AAGWGHLDPVAVAWARDAAARGPVALLSNMPHEVKEPLAPLIAEAAGIADMFFSCDLGVVKPEAGAYEETLRRLGVAPGDAVMVDDRPVNVDGAARAGLRAVLFTTLAESIPRVDRELTRP
ncbi:MAG: HAD-IA family hydrolase, partial [Actinomycetota bacterium]